jgi:putative phosphoribosyl transferase
METTDLLHVPPSRGALRLPAFDDRRDAGRRLGGMLGPQAGDVVVVGLACGAADCGGVVVAAEVSAALAAPLDALAVVTVHDPKDPTLTIGAVVPGTELKLGHVEDLAAPELGGSVAAAAREAALLELTLHEGLGALELDGRKVILIDDGVATGTTMAAAVDRVRRLGAARVVVGTPVAAVEGLKRVLAEAGEMICLHTVPELTSIGAWYRSSPELDAAAAVRALVQSRRVSSSALSRR